MLFLMLFLGSFVRAASQVLTTTLARFAQSNTGVPDSSADGSRSGLPTESADGDFRKRVEARWSAARKGEIEVYLVPDSANHEIFTVHVVVTRAPAGSDGMTAVSSSGSASWSALLKLDDEILVSLSPKDVGVLDIETHDATPDRLIRHLDPGGHAEWSWTVRRIKPGENRLQLQADVVYRRKFSPGGKPVVTYPSAQKLLSLP
jgi:hypothetical protein